MTRELVLEVPNDLRAIENTVALVVKRCEFCESQARRLDFNFRVCLSEALANAMLYGNRGDGHKRVRLEVTLGTDEVRARITDQGEGFDPNAIPDPTQPENITRTGGRGLFLMRKLMDEVYYNDRGNSVTLVLRLGASSGVEVDGAASA